MKKLREEFNSGVGGFSSAPLIYKQIVRNNNNAVYRRSSSDGSIRDYETIRIAIVPKGKVIFDKVVEVDTESYPSSSSWGRLAWSFPREDLAINKFNDLSDKPELQRARNIKKDFTIPDKEFTVKELAELNSSSYINASLFVKKSVANGSINFLRKECKNGARKPSSVYERNKTKN